MLRQRNQAVSELSGLSGVHETVSKNLSRNNG